jgi:hypothetical protein
MNALARYLPLSVLVLLAACDEQAVLHVVPTPDRHSFLMRVSQLGDTTSPVKTLYYLAVHPCPAERGTMPPPNVWQIERESHKRNDGHPRLTYQYGEVPGPEWTQSGGGRLAPGCYVATASMSGLGASREFTVSTDRSIAER